MKKRIAVFIAAVLAGVYIGMANGAIKDKEIIYTVQENDTVWSIAKKNTPSDEDVRKKVQEIIDDNMLKDAVVHPGQQLIIHTHKK